MASSATQHAFNPAWSVRLVSDLNASVQAAQAPVSGLTEEQLNWQPTPGSWSVGQCLEHLCITNEAYLPAISDALVDKPDSPVDQISPGWFGGWFLRKFVVPSPQTKKVSAPPKITPAKRVSLSVLNRFLACNQSCCELIRRAGAKDVNHIRFWNPFVKGVRFTVGTGLEIVAAHERRHLLQAERVLASADFMRHQTS